MSLLAPIRRRRAGQAGSSGLLRSIRLFRLFLTEQADPEGFYSKLAEDAVQQVAEHCELGGRTVVDIGGGGGWFTAAFRARGAHAYLFEPDPDELHWRGVLTPGAVLADGYWLPVRDRRGRRGVLLQRPGTCRRSSMGLIEEMIRATRPGGLIYLSFCNWYSPWGGHEMSPWHYLGPRFAERRYVKHHQQTPKHACGVNLYQVHIGPVLRALRARPDITMVTARPRYYPRWCRPLVRLPGVREVATWNLLLIMRRTR